MGRKLLLAVTAGLSVACATASIENQQTSIRQAMLQLHEEQILDNLIRAMEGLPMLHLEYTQASGTLKRTLSGSFEYEEENPPVAGVTKTITGMAGASGESTVQVSAKPVVDSTEIYLAYLRFANDPDLFQKSEGKPDGALTFRKWDGHYYFVPRSARSEFQSLALRASTLRGKTEKLPTLFEVKVEQLGAFVAVDSAQKKAEITLSSPVPNGAGRLTVEVQGIGNVHLDVRPYDKEIDGKVPSAFQDTKKVYVTYADSEVGLTPAGKTEADLRNAIAGKKVSIEIFGRVPSQQSPTQSIETLVEELRLLRLQDLSN